VKANDIITAAGLLVGGDRKAAYGDVVSGLTRIAIYWNAHLHATSNAPPSALTAEDVAKFMVLLKLARSETGPIRMDNYVDGAGWFGIAGEAAARLDDQPSAVFETKGKFSAAELQAFKDLFMRTYKS
jgi:hypothetical protein